MTSDATCHSCKVTSYKPKRMTMCLVGPHYIEVPASTCPNCKDVIFHEEDAEAIFTALEEAETLVAHGKSN